MKVLSFIFVTTFLVIAAKPSDPDVTTTEVSVSANEVKTEVKTPEGEGQSNVLNDIEIKEGSLICYAIVTVLKTVRFLENGVLNESEAEETVDLIEGVVGGGLVRERAGNCTRKANLETGDCKIVRTFLRCVGGNTNGTETVAQNED